MEYLTGGTLHDRLGRPIALTEVLSLIHPIAEALDYAHGQGIVHRDVKPPNVLVDAGGVPKLSDFGLARLLEGSVGLTGTGAVFGTPEYMSPEQAMGRPADQKSDLYSLGIVIYQMLLGEVPFMGETPVATLMAHVHQPVPRPSTLDATMEPQVEADLLKALAKSPDDRYQSASEMVQSLALVSGQTIEAHIGDEPPADVPCPYKGLTTFDLEDAEYFFGREELVGELVARLAVTGFLAVVGPSGSGKSSMVRAGLLSAIRQGALPDSQTWQTITLTPGEHPLEELAIRISLLRAIAPGSLLEDLNPNPPKEGVGLAS